MNCQKAGDLLSVYIDGELAGRQGRALEAHLTDCSGCRAELETLRSAVALLEAPKTLARPEGLLEEFKAKYLPEAEAAAAPRWSFRLPALPRIEWPSLGQILVPMGGMAAAAAALLVVLHGHPAGVATGPSAAGPVARQLAQVPAASPAAEKAAPAAAANHAERVAALPTHEVEPATAEPSPPPSLRGAPARVPGTASARSHPSLRFEASGFPVAHHRSRRAARRELNREWDRSAARSPHRAARRSSGLVLARRPILVPPVSEMELAGAAARHEAAVPTPESQWADQVVVIRRKAAVDAAGDGFAEASCKNLKTGEVKSAAMGVPAEPAGETAAPVVGDPDAGK